MTYSAETFCETPTLSPSAKPARSRQATLGQFFTPALIADFMAGLFSPPDGTVRLLDAGAGEGALTQAFVARWCEGSIAADAYEVDDEVLPTLIACLRDLEGDGITARAFDADFLDAAAAMIQSGEGERYTRAILNPAACAAPRPA